MAKEIVENKEEIVENKEETTEKNDKTIEDITKEIIEVAKPEKKDSKKVSSKALDIIAQSRGFKSIKEAEAYVESEGFGKLHVLDQNEFKNWLKEIKK